VVARNSYEALAGFRQELRQTLDWEMWERIASRFPVWYEPRALAVYLRPPGTDGFVPLDDLTRTPPQP